MLQRKKKVFFKHETHKLDVPGMEELSVDATWDKAVTIKGFLDYIPDQWTEPGKVQRSFYWEILSTLAPEWVMSMVKQSDDMRAQNKHGRKQVKKNIFPLDEDMCTMFLQGDFVSGKWL